MVSHSPTRNWRGTVSHTRSGSGRTYITNIPLTPLANRLAHVCAVLGVGLGPAVGLAVAVAVGVRYLVAVGRGVLVRVGVSVGVDVAVGGSVGTDVAVKVALGTAVCVATGAGTVAVAHAPSIKRRQARTNSKTLRIAALRAISRWFPILNLRFKDSSPAPRLLFVRAIHAHPTILL